jgi:hypothetical protein
VSKDRESEGIEVRRGVSCMSRALAVRLTPTVANQEAHHLALKCMKGLAAIAVKVLIDEGFYRDVKEAFDEMKGGL